ncbi:MAG: phosphatase PAP2 family protein [Terrabacter sp.]|nr:phosphatase PAP2 family protein [Dermatophilaceae bacterium]NUR82261.1 phosphatase PAP2 family protein [Dermatophilaceae bacterium]NUS40298.1 phosphatase PAP2 family protein [Terrabacter sp.]
MRQADRPPTPDDTIGTRDLTSWHSRFGRWLVAVTTRTVQWSSAHLAFVVFAAIAIVVMVGLVEGIETVYESVAENRSLAAVDQPVLDAAVSLRSPGLDSAVTDFTDVGGPVGMPILAAGAVAVITWRRRRWTPITLALVAAAGSLAMTIVGKDFVARARPPAALAVPPLEISPSFPSGHTLNATVLTAVVAYLVLIETTATWQRVVTITVATLFVVAMGLSRVFLGHHWLTDVVAGWLIGLAWALVVVTAHRLWLTLRQRPKGTPAATGGTVVTD